jgi:predicted NBD/HSP70 family sugar kinase
MARYAPDADYLAAQAAGFPCAGCGGTWTGARRCHCGKGGCHQTFSSASAFDKHRQAFACRPPAESGLVLTDGVWCHPGARPERNAA